MQHCHKVSLSTYLQHYGYTFSYRTLMLDYNKPTPALPQSCVSLTERFVVAYHDIDRALSTDTTISENTKLVDQSEILLESQKTRPEAANKADGLVLNQLTINEYKPGQGISSHTGRVHIYEKAILHFDGRPFVTTLLLFTLHTTWFCWGGVLFGN